MPGERFLELLRNFRPSWPIAQKIPADFRDFRFKRQARNVLAGLEDLGTVRQFFSEIFKIHRSEGAESALVSQFFVKKFQSTGLQFILG